ncbi:MAG: hypothetical protein DMF70_09895 [Acidobacteria bacterium]|nr:MAG: hypothetical protein DMF70_09895 [Acidobacteriota bacterium]
MSSAKTQPARGMRDFLPADVRKREYVIGVIKEVYERYGFEPLETPAVENIETLMGKYGEEGNQLIFKILKRGEHEKTGEADLALRYDLTVPLARVVAQYQNELPKFFKRYQIQPVWRAAMSMCWDRSRWWWRRKFARPRVMRSQRLVSTISRFD